MVWVTTCQRLTLTLLGFARTATYSTTTQPVDPSTLCVGDTEKAAKGSMLQPQNRARNRDTYFGTAHYGAGSDLGVNSVGDLLPASDLLRGEHPGGKGVPLTVVGDLGGFGDDEAYRARQSARTYVHKRRGWRQVV